MKKPVCPHFHHPVSYRAAFKGQWNWLQETTCPHCKMTVYPSLRYRKKSSVLVLFMIPVIFSFLFASNLVPPHYPSLIPKHTSILFETKKSF